MPGRTPKPWFWKSRLEWYVTIKGERHRLGADKEEATRQFHRLMAGDIEEVSQEPARDWLYASEVVDDFQIFLQAERSEATLDWYCGYLDPFKEEFLTRRADTLTLDAVEHWVKWKWKSQASRRAAFRSVKAAFRMAVRKGKLIASPIASMQLPGETSRDYCVQREEYHKVIKAITDETFADLIRFVWLSGARPQEALLVDDSHVELKNSRLVFPVKQAKGKKKPRVVYLSEEALNLVKSKMGGGKLFKTKRGVPYSKDLVRMRFRTLEKTLKFRYCLYHFRHAFAHRSLAAGNDALTVATLMGHCSTQTLARVYSHLNQADGHLREALKKTE